MNGLCDLVAISTNKSFIQRCKALTEDFSFLFRAFDCADDFYAADEELSNIKCFILDCTTFDSIHESAGAVQVSRQMMERSYIITILNSRLQPEDMDMLKKSGANLLMLDSEFTTNSKLEFVTSQIIKAAFIPVKIVDLIPQSRMGCALLLLMPKNGKFLRVYKAEQLIDGTFLKKYEEVKELYIHRNDVEHWLDYVQSYQTQDELMEARSSRANFLKLQQAFLDLVLLISDQTTSTSFVLGKDLFTKCEMFCSDLLGSLKEVSYPWEIINNSSIGDFGSIERSTAVAAYAGMLSEKIAALNGAQVMVGALLADIGLILVSPEVTRKIRSGDIEALVGEQRMEYEKHPIYGLNQVLSKRIPLSELGKDMILMSHERMDQKGFPNRPGSVKIKEEAMVVRLAHELDQELMLKMGKERRDYFEMFQDFFQEKVEKIDGYPLAMLLKLKTAFSPTKVGKVVTVSS